MFKKENKKLSRYHGVLVWVIIALLGLILIVLVFKTGMMVGKSKSNFSYCKGDYSHKYSSELKDKKFGYIKKSAYSSYQGVIRLTEDGFVAKGADGKEQVVIINDDTKIIKGKETIEGGVSVGDKVYFEGPTLENGQVVATLIKIYEKSL